MAKKDHVGSKFEDYLRQDGQLEAATAVAVKRVVAWQIEKAMKRGKVKKSELAIRLGTSRAQLDRLLDPDNAAITVESLARVAAALGKRLKIELAV